MRRCVTQFAALASALVLSVAVSSRVTAQSTNRFTLSTASNSSPVVAQLKYCEMKGGIFSWGISVLPQTAPFAKEPGTSNRKVARGRLDFRPGSGQAIGFIWDAEQDKLHLDLNGNGDLTDETNAVFTSQARSSDRRYQAFTDVRLTFQTASGPYPLLFDLNFNQYSRLYVSASLRSFYAGKVTLGDQDWQIGIIEKPYSALGALKDVSLLLRPWTEQTQSFQVDGGDLVAFPLPQALFVAGHSYRLSPSWENTNTNWSCRLELTQQEVPLGELKITGNYIHRALLTDAGRAVLVDMPNGTMRVPQGTYARFQVHLQKGEGRASLKSDFINRGVNRRIVVGGDSPAVLAAGGPLTNTVTLTRRGALLVLNYSVVGVGGEAYEVDGVRDYEHPPTFTIHQGDKQLATGKFEFG